MTYITNNTADAEYQTDLATFVLDFEKMALEGRAPTLREVVDHIQPDQNNRLMLAFCLKHKIATKAEFNREVNRGRQRDALGIAPANATELVEAFASTHSVKAKLNGMLTREVKATYVDSMTGKTLPITRADREAAADVDLMAAFHFDARSRMNRLDFERELRILSTNLRIGIAPADITDAVDEWFRKAHRERLHEIFVDVEAREPSYDAPAMWLKLAEDVFDCSETSPAFVAAVLRKFVWQVKRKIRGMEVFDHLMPVILGPQGIGKSTLVNRLLGPVSELKLNVDFQMITDDRNVEIWQSYVMFLDEMGYASKADIDTVKNIITASTLTRRPMRTNSMVTIDQKATLIGCSNRELGQLVRDPTGIRRFVGIRMRSDADRALINSLDWSLMWGDVRVTDADPLAAHRTVLADQQEDSRELGRVEKWMAEFTGANNAYQAGINKAGNIPAADLYRAYREFEDENFPGVFKTSKTDWDYEMARLRKNSPTAVIFDKKRGGAGIMYRWIGEVNLRVVE
ncbi:VapE domain-containing protein [Sphingomonas sp. Leaf242]|uniref:VapE domain-containing protein n=1 Tax=Sphingomonas sp. Leaf242 TaxID=1736304 RepID=UPI000712AB0B|nr:VapE domain-containing protein [Sphingomonas sp. Leaf242]KQO06919.1 hypothetical protein ASF09_11705 [Sphingomonas sp. Leaf242]